MPIARPPYTPPCENTVPCPVNSLICDGGSICVVQCIPVALNEFQSFDLPTVGQAYDQFILKTAGSSPIAWTITAGALPAGLTLNASTGLISGTPTGASPTSGSVTFQALNCVDQTDTIAWTWSVSACVAPGPVLPADITPPYTGVAYSQTFTATGSTSTFTLSGDPLPGASLSSSGVLTWASPVAGSYTFTVTATNACGTTNQDYVITVTTAPTPVALRYGQFVYADFPAAAPTFVAGDFTGSNPNYTPLGSSNPSSANGSYPFTESLNSRQVMWIADSLLGGSPIFTVDGFPWVIDPSSNTALQSLTIGGIPGKVFFTANQNGGAYTVVIAGATP